jgi:CheY-like chemotaxis protein
MRGVLHQAFTFISQTPPPRAEGYRLVRVLGRNLSWLDVPSDPRNGYAVLGAHERSDLVLANDAGVSLRHLVAIVVRLKEERLGLRLIDLRTGLPFFFDDDTPRRSALVRGQFAVRVGRHVICGFPIAPPRAPNGALQDEATGVHGGAKRLPNAGSESRGSMSASTSGLFAVGALLTSSADLRVPSASGYVHLTLSHLRSERWWTGATAEVPLVEFDGGMILGRAHGCFAGAHDVSSDVVSAPHLLLLRERGHLYAFDLASSNGTRANGERIRRYRVPESGARIELARRLVLTVGRWSAGAPPGGASWRDGLTRDPRGQPRRRGDGFDMERQRRRVLVIEDDALLGKMVRRALEPEHDIVVLTSANEALDHIARGERFGLVLCDLMLPGVSGVDFHELVGSLAPELVEHIIFITGGAYTPRAEAFLKRADIRYIEKPFSSVAALRAVVQEHFRRASGRVGPEGGSP